jgi:hypothetical protein
MNKKQKIEIEIPIKEFHMSMIQPDSVCLYVAKRNSGKSTLIKDTLFYHQDIPVCTVISPSEEENEYFSKFVPPMFIHYEYNSQLLERVIERQKNIIAKVNQDPITNRNIDTRMVVVMDDCLYDKRSWSKDVNIRRIFMNGRHLKLFYLLTMQYPLGIGPELRSNVDWVFLLRVNNVKDKERLYDYYAGFFPNFHIFEQVFDQLTENFGCMVINNNAKSSKIEDCVFRYKAQLHPEFKMCHNEFWQKSVNKVEKNYLQQHSNSNNSYQDFRTSKYNVKISEC